MSLHLQPSPPPEEKCQVRRLWAKGAQSSTSCRGAPVPPCAPCLTWGDLLEQVGAALDQDGKHGEAQGAGLLLDHGAAVFGQAL